ncbi:hypothetical protein CUPS4244_02740 [Campylobacter upsaliensis]|nr:hypothetical protein [Campylobacter upsaliensis]MCR2104014.1 hypothetical protein [Campylobacter upsaliensis]
MRLSLYLFILLCVFIAFKQEKRSFRANKIFSNRAFGVVGTSYREFER